MSYVNEFSFLPPFKFLYCVNTVTQIYHTYWAAFMCFFSSVFNAPSLRRPYLPNPHYFDSLSSQAIWLNYFGTHLIDFFAPNETIFIPYHSEDFLCFVHPVMKDIFAPQQSQPDRRRRTVEYLVCRLMAWEETARRGGNCVGTVEKLWLLTNLNLLTTLPLATLLEEVLLLWAILQLVPTKQPCLWRNNLGSCSRLNWHSWSLSRCRGSSLQQFLLGSAVKIDKNGRNRELTRYVSRIS